jgi:PiT family inorganic phosphate transporter
VSAQTAIVVAITLAWAVSGGIHDAGTLAASGIASRALTPRLAIVIVGVFGFIGPIVAGTAVAETISSFVDLSGLAPGPALWTIAAGLASAIVWNVITWRAGIPASSTHGMVGGLVGATIVAAGFDDVNWGFESLADGNVEGVAKVVVALLVSPLIGFVLGAVLMRAGGWAFRSADIRWNRRLRSLQVPTVAALSFAHGVNEAQKSMGIIALTLVAGGTSDSFAVPTWTVVVCAATIPAGAIVGGWRIVRTLGFGIYRLRPIHATGAQLASATVVGATSVWGGPVSTSQVTSSAVIGVGAAEHPREVRWATGKSILVAWVFTIPCTAVLAAIIVAVLQVTGVMD